MKESLRAIFYFHLCIFIVLWARHGTCHSNIQHGNEEQRALCDLAASLGIVNYESACIHNIPIFAVCNQSRSSWPGVSCEEDRVIGLTFNSRSLIGTIPASIGSLTSIELLNFQNNLITGTIPSEIGYLTKLNNLQLGFNELTGTIPSLLGQLTGLTQLKLYWNNLSGTLSSTFGYMTKMQYLYIFSNSLTGSIPTSFCQMILLKAFCTMANKYSPTDLFII